MKSAKFYYCEHCKNIVMKVCDKGVPVICCGEKMKELIPNSSGASEEKHKPSISVEGKNVTVKVGSGQHPMQEDHHIVFICIETDKGVQIKYPCIGGPSEANFALSNDEKILSSYEFCNPHGLWKSEI
ncbi:MAG: desulfoferrodoxin Dfx [Firmicutes bacterium]|nr:desulfoferrodoxin Dfx [Bacillota bacterium]